MTTMPPAKSSGSRNRWPLLGITLRVFELQCALLVRRDHGDAGMHRVYDLAPRLGVESVGELAQPLVQSAPELNACGNRWRHLDRAQARDMLVADPAVLPVGFDQAHCQPVGRLAKVHEYCSGTIIASLPSEARPLLAAPASSSRTLFHSITSSACASNVGGTVRPSAFAVNQIDDEIEFGRLLDRQVGRLRAAQDLVDIVSSAPSVSGHPRNFFVAPVRQGSYSLEWPSGYGAGLGIPFSVAEPARRNRGGSRCRCRAISTPPARNICATSTRPSAWARPPIRVALAGQRARSPRRRCATPSATQASSPPTSTACCPISPATRPSRRSSPAISASASTSTWTCSAAAPRPKR